MGFETRYRKLVDAPKKSGSGAKSEIPRHFFSEFSDDDGDKEDKNQLL